MEELKKEQEVREQRSKLLDAELQNVRAEYNQFKILQAERVKLSVEKKKKKEEESEEEESEEEEVIVNKKRGRTTPSTRYEFDDLNEMDNQHYKMRPTVKKKEIINYHKLIKGE